MSYKPKDRPYTPILAKQIAKQEERIKECGMWAYCSFHLMHNRPLKQGSIYSNRFKTNKPITIMHTKGLILPPILFCTSKNGFLH